MSILPDSWKMCSKWLLPIWIELVTKYSWTTCFWYTATCHKLTFTHIGRIAGGLGSMSKCRETFILVTTVNDVELSLRLALVDNRDKVSPRAKTSHIVWYPVMLSALFSIVLCMLYRSYYGRGSRNYWIYSYTDFVESGSVRNRYNPWRDSMGSNDVIWDSRTKHECIYLSHAIVGYTAVDGLINDNLFALIAAVP